MAVGTPDNEPLGESLGEIVDLLLAYSGTPRDELFEYPHRADDSRRYIKEAQMLAEKIRHILGHLEDN